MTRNAWGHGLATVTVDGGTTLEVWYPDPRLGGDPVPDGTLTDLERTDEARGVRTVAVTTVVPDLDAPPTDPADAYLRLHLLSHRLVQPHGMNLDGIFGVLENVVWTDVGPCSPVDFETTRARVRATLGRAPVVHAVDKFPRMVDYVLPSGVRVGDGARVRLGAHLAEGTTVMHEGFVNYNAGTLGPSMVEGRISAGVVVDAGSDIGGGASIMGTLSGGGTVTNSIGRRSLLGANAGLGFPLGDDCVIEAGLYVTAGTKVRVVDPASLAHALEGVTPADDGSVVVKARDLAGVPGLLFRRHSTTGAVEVLRRTSAFDLNPDLHAN